MDLDINSFLGDVSRYFRDFLETDFKRVNLPKRAITRKDRSGNQTQIALHKYPSLEQVVWKLLAHPPGNQFEISIPRGRYKAKIDKSIIDLISKQIESLEASVFDNLKNQANQIAEDNVRLHKDDPDSLHASVIGKLEILLLNDVVRPLLEKLKPFFDRQDYQTIEAITEVEDELTNQLVHFFDEIIVHSLNTLITNNGAAEYNEVIEDMFDEVTTKRRLKEYFMDFNSSDAYSELHQLRNTVSTKDNIDFYLYIGELHFKGHAFPLCFFPAQLTQNKTSFQLNLDPRLYINKRAIDYAYQEILKEDNSRAASLIKDRIVYLGNDEKPIDKIQELLDKLVASYSLATTIDLDEPRDQISKSSNVAIRNRISIAVADKTDESVINDYEQLLTIAQSGGSVFEVFSDIITGFITSEPPGIASDVENSWAGTPLQDRLVVRSPIPLNEEQRKILIALNKKDGRFVVVQGPPGTGKSHTITAIAFDAILKNRSVLILSDKTEALDVVESKLTDTLNKVRLGDDFQNPLLRLSKSGSSYNKILSSTSIDKIRTSQRAWQSKREKLENEIDANEKRLKTTITNESESYEVINLPDIHLFLDLEKQLEKEFGEEVSHLSDPDFTQALENLTNMSNELAKLDKLTPLLESISQLPTSELILGWLRIQQNIAEGNLLLGGSKSNLNLFGSFRKPHLIALEKILRQYKKVQWPLFGFVFCRSKADDIDQQAGDELQLINSLDLHKKLDQLQATYSFLAEFSVILSDLGDGLDSLEIGFHHLRNEIIPLSEEHTKTIINLVNTARTTLDKYPSICASLGYTSDVKTWVRGFNHELDDKRNLTSNTIIAYIALTKKFAAIPNYSYLQGKTELEQFHTQDLANRIDAKVIDFYDNKRTIAKSLRTIISKKQKFPRDKFDDIKYAFPCIIAGIRDYAEYIPLEAGIFDLVIIDEASQVSIAQALPALIRGKKVLVLGDQKQFSNVKTTNAATEINNGYVHDLMGNALTNVDIDSDVQARLEKFNIKTSILDFIDNIASYSALLKKHFRGYPEHIGFSSKWFYNGTLQAVKIRGIPLSDVLMFDLIDHDELFELTGNTNQLEADLIEEELGLLLELNTPPTVGIITPFTDQQKYLSTRLFNSEHADKFRSTLRLKVMTFDTCQGEERDTIIYSMVATKTHDKLNHIFPRELSVAAQSAADVESQLRMQRLNVGFSRAKEKMHFVISKPIEDFSGSIGVALRHYADVYSSANEDVDFDKVDPNSPMERKVLEWLQQTSFYLNYQLNLEVLPQFPLGDYLKQLDPYYNHPAYRVDFLIRLKSEDSLTQVIIEYDGFKEHFADLDKVDASNYQDYYKPADIEREKVLESYGYKFLRINRFNLGKDPVETLNTRLIESLVPNSANKNSIIDEVLDDVEKLTSNEFKICPVCGIPKPREDFLDNSLKSGEGRNCIKCKEKVPEKTPPEEKQLVLGENCPKCKAGMIKRKARRGRNAGNYFLGCSKFPRCNGTRDLARDQSNLAT